MDYHAVPRKIWDRLDAQSDGCLLWPGATGGSKNHRYGIAIFEKGGTLKLVHREIYLRVVGPAPGHVHHKCNVTLCCNPLHLEALDVSIHIGQWHREKTHCPHGHPYDAENTYIKKDGSRDCRTCARFRARRRRGDSRTDSSDLRRS